MKLLLTFLLSALLSWSSGRGIAMECIEEHSENTEALYRVGCCAKDGAYTATSSSMIGWGIALFVVIAIVVGIAHQSKTSSTSSSSSATDSDSST